MAERSQPAHPPNIAVATADVEAAPASRTAHLVELKRELIKWRDEFPGKHGRQFTTEDIKQDARIGR